MGDNLFCPPCKINTRQDQPMITNDDGDEVFDAKPHMVRMGMLITIIIFLLIGLIFTFINIVFTVLNIAHNPVSSIMGIDGLVVWNFIAGNIIRILSSSRILFVSRSDVLAGGHSLGS